MKKLLLHEFKVLYATNAEFKRQLDNFNRAVESNEWKFFRDAILTVKGLIYSEMLSARFTDLDPQEKDTLQKVYFEVVQLLDFFSKPLGWIKRKNRWTGINPANLKGEGKSNSKRRRK